MDENLKREIILENHQNPINKEVVNDDRYIKVNTNNESCIDNLDIYILVEDNIIKDIKFDGEACAISTSSTLISVNSSVGGTRFRFCFMNLKKVLKSLKYSSTVFGDLPLTVCIYKR